jgi:hypothetical protein
MSKPRYKVGDLIEATYSEGKKFFLITKVEQSTHYDSTYGILTENGKHTWDFCATVDNQYHFRKIN